MHVLENIAVVILSWLTADVYCMSIIRQPRFYRDFRKIYRKCYMHPYILDQRSSHIGLGRFLKFRGGRVYNSAKPDWMAVTHHSNRRSILRPGGMLHGLICRLTLCQKVSSQLLLISIYILVSFYHKTVQCSNDCSLFVLKMVHKLRMPWFQLVAKGGLV